jgi:carbon-monoxide dehydrogenase medium subunit
MIPRFSLARPETLADAFAAYAAAGGDGAYLAGGTELLQVMKMGFAQFGTLIDLKRVPDLRGISRNGALRIGGGMTHREIERSPLVAEAAPGLIALERRVANVRVRSTGTLGGNLAFAEPHSDPATFLLACGASVEVAGPAADDRRSIAMADFLVGPLATALEPGEILVAIMIPLAGPGEGRAYDKLAFFERPAASVAVRLVVAGGVVQDATVAVGSIGEIPVDVPDAAAALRGVPATPADVERAAASAEGTFDDVDTVADLNGSADYKRHLAAVLLRRAARAALEEAVARA